MRQLPWERERGEVNHERNLVRNNCRWRTLKPLGNTGPMKPTKGNTPGEAELSNDPTECGETAAGAAEPSPRGSNAPLEKLAVTTAFPRKVIGRRGPRRRDGGTAAGRRDGGTAGQWDDRAAGRRDNGMTGRRDGGTVGRRGNRKTAGRWDGATVGCQCSGTAGRNGRLWSGGGGNVLRNTAGGRWAVEWVRLTWVSVAG